MKTLQLIFKVFICLLCFFTVEKVWAQNVGISAANGFTPDASAGLDISFTNKGLLVPRVALTATNAATPITLPATSLLVYNTATAGTSPNNVIPGYYYWNGTAWVLMNASAQATGAWSTTGNTGTTAGTNFIGTIDNKDFVVKTNNTEAGRFTGAGNLGIGSTTFSATNAEKLLVDAGTSSFNVISGRGNINNYLQLNIQNSNAGANASSDVVATANNGTETTNFVNMGINNSGNTAASFGGANDSYLYSVGGSANGGNLFIGTSTAGKVLGFLTGGGATTNERMRIDGTGNVGIGTTAPTEKLDVNGNLDVANSIYVDGAATNTGNKAPGLVFGGQLSGETISSKRTAGTNQYGLDFYTSSTLQMTVAAGGNVGIGTNTPASKLTVAGSIAPAFDNSYNLGNAGARWYNVYASNSFIQGSDRRLKTNIKALNYGLKEVLALQPVSYNWKEKPTTGHKIGLIAQDVRKVVPEVVIGDEAKEKLGMNYAELIPVLINAIKEQQKEIADLKKAVQKLLK